MNSHINSCIKFLLFFAIPIFCILKKLGLGYLTSISWTISVSTIIFIIYTSYFWRFNPFCKIPRIYGKYNIKICHKYNGGGEKDAEAEIKQSLLNLTVTVKTDEIRSYSTAACIVEEHNCFVLYYTYIKDPKSKYEQGNPIMYGACRIVIEDINPQIFANAGNSNNKDSILIPKRSGLFFPKISPVSQQMDGIYWTSRENTGDIIFTRKGI